MILRPQSWDNWWSLCQCGSGWDYPAAILALCPIKTDHRDLDFADQFLKGLFETALDDGEIITPISFPIPEKAELCQILTRVCYTWLAFCCAKQRRTRCGHCGAGPSAFR